ncbi:hypothetical protein V2I01_27400 [Micromonospora sp. BRA006-A]|nr:hypothetical protein [Micromonospora sp. BRA006-A]
MKTALTVGALAVTGYSRLVGMRLEKPAGRRSRGPPNRTTTPRRTSPPVSGR